MVAITGPTKSGKSMFLEKTLPALFGNLSIATSKPTEAGIRQEVGHTSRVLMIDEFENDQHRQRILDLFKLSGRGSKVLRGQPSQRAMSFGLRHIPWFGAIETGLAESADKNRCIILDLDHVKKAAGAETLRLPPEDQLAELGQRLMVVAMRYWKAAKANAAIIGDHIHGQLDQRLVQNYGVPVGLSAAVMGASREAMMSVFHQIVSERDLEDQSESDEDALLDEIFSSVINLSHSERASVSQLLRASSIEFREDPDIALQRHGLRRCEHGGVEGVFLHPTRVRRHLLRDSEAKRFVDLRTILLRVHGAEACRERFDGMNLRGVWIPMRMAIPDSGELPYT